MSPVDDDDPQLGRVLGGQYRIEAQLGQGGMGAVYRGLQLSVQRPVAIKLIGAMVADKADLVTRFRREAEATARLSHPNTVRLFDFGVTEKHELFMVMELLEGSDLAVRLQRGPLPPLDALHVVREVLQALAEAHALGIIHRDLKPGNVFLSRVHSGESIVKVMDFGIAGLEEARDGQKLTVSGAVMGTPAYMSPEQAQGKAVDSRSDLYSIGVMLFEVLTGQPPFDANTLMSLLLAHVTQPPKRLADVGLALPHEAALQGLLDRLLAKQPADRLPSAAAAIDEVEALLAVCEGSAPLTGRAELPASLAQTQQPHTPLSWDRAPAPLVAALPRQARGPWLAASLIGLAAIGLGLWLLLAPRQPQAAAPSALPPAAAELDARSVMIASTPAGAHVLENQVELGRTPFRFAFKHDTQLELRLPGYQPLPLRVTRESEPTLALALQRLRQRDDKPARESDSDSTAAQTGAAASAAQSSADEPRSLEPRAKRSRAEGRRATREGGSREPEEPAREDSANTSTGVVAAQAPLQQGSDAARQRRELLLKRAPPFPSIAAAQRAYNAGKINADTYEDAVWVLKTRRNERIEIEKDNLKKGAISAQEYEWRLGRIDAELRGE